MFILSSACLLLVVSLFMACSCLLEQRLDARKVPGAWKRAMASLTPEADSVSTLTLGELHSRLKSLSSQMSAQKLLDDIPILENGSAHRGLATRREMRC